MKGNISIWWWYSLERNTGDWGGRGSSSDDLQNLLQSRQAAAHLEGHLVRIVLLSQGHRKQSYSQGTPMTQQTGDYVALNREGTFFLSRRAEGLKSQTKWSLKYSCLISNVHRMTPPRSSQVSLKGNWSAGSSLAPGWSNRTKRKLRQWPSNIVMNMSEVRKKIAVQNLEFTATCNSHKRHFCHTILKPLVSQTCRTSLLYRSF